MVPATALAPLFIGLGQTGAFVASLVVTTVINTAIASVLGKLLAPSIGSGRDTRGLQTTVKNNISPRTVIYGEALVGGTLIEINTGGSTNQFLDMIIVLATHPVEDILGVFVSDQYIDIHGDNYNNNALDPAYNVKDGGKFGSTNNEDPNFNIMKIIKVNGWGWADKKYVNDEDLQEYINDRTRSRDIEDYMERGWPLPAEVTKVRDSSTGLYSGFHPRVTNCPYVYLRLEYNPDVWGGSIPKFRFHVKGKRLYNPNLDNSLISQGATGGAHSLTNPDTWEYSEDWTLCVLDYLTDKQYGLAAKTDGTDANPSEINWASAIEAYNVSSEQVTNGLESPQEDFGPRYTINGVFECSQTPISIMEAMLTSGSGELVYAQGEYKILPGIYRAPSSPNDIINENDIVSGLSIKTHAARPDVFNKAAGVFVDKKYDSTQAIGQTTNLPLFESSDFPFVDPTDSSGTNPYEVIDGEEIIKEFDFPYTTDPYMAQRLAKIQIERSRRGMTVSFEGTLNLIKYSVGDNVYLEILSDGKYSNEVFFNKLGFDDTVQNRPDTPFTAYYKQFKIVDMQYTENSTIAVTMIEEDEGIYEWNSGQASEPGDEIIAGKPGDNPWATVLSPIWDTPSPINPIEEVVGTVAGSPVRTLVRWVAPVRDSANHDVLDITTIGSYRLEYGVVDNPSQALPEDRVSVWIPGGTIIADPTVSVQGPIALTAMFLDNLEYDFRIRSVTYTQRASAWAYYSVFAGADYSPSAPPSNTTDIYYIKPTNGTAIKNGTGTLTLEARQIIGGVDTLISTGDIQLYVNGTTLVTVANGFATPSDGYTGTFDAGDINGSIVVELRNGSGGTVLDTVTIVDITDGLDSVVGYIEATNGLAWVQETDNGAWNPTATFTNLDVTFVKAGTEVARTSRRVNRSSTGILTDGSEATHASGNLNTGTITPVITGDSTQALTVEYTYSSGSDTFVVAETVITARGGSSPSFYYIKPTNGTAIKNGSGTLTIEAHLVDETGDNLLSTGSIKLYNPSNQIITVANGYASPSDGYTGTFDAGDINGDIVITLKDGAAGDPLDTITLVDLADGADPVVGWIEADPTLSWLRGQDGVTWDPTATSTQFNVTFSQSGTDVARWARTINRAANGILSDGGAATHPSGNLNTGNITPTIFNNNSQAINVQFVYFDGTFDYVVRESAITTLSGETFNSYYIKPLNGTAIKNSTGTLTIEARLNDINGDNLLTSGTVQLYDPSDTLVTVANGYASPSDGYTGTLDSGDINGSKIITLKDGPSGEPLDTIALVDVSDGDSAVAGFMEGNPNINWVRSKDQVTWDPVNTYTKLDITFVQNGADVARTAWRVERDADGILTGWIGNPDSHGDGPLNTSRVTHTVIQENSQVYTLQADYNFGGFQASVTESVQTVLNGAAGAINYYIKPLNGTAIRDGTGTLTLEARQVDSNGDTLLSSGGRQLYVGGTLVTVANGFASPSDGYTGTFDAGDINSDVVVQLRDGPVGQVLDSITLVDITDGSDSIVGFIEPTNGLSWVRSGKTLTWTPSSNTTNLDVTFNQGGTDVARQSYQVTLNKSTGNLTGTPTTHTSGDLNTSRITITPTGSGTNIMTVKFDYSFGGFTASVSETVGSVLPTGEQPIVGDPNIEQGSSVWAGISGSVFYRTGEGTNSTDAISMKPSGGTGGSDIFWFAERRGTDNIYDTQTPGNKFTITVNYRIALRTQSLASSWGHNVYPVVRISDVNEANVEQYFGTTNQPDHLFTQADSINVWYDESITMQIDDSAAGGSRPRYISVGLFAPSTSASPEYKIDYLQALIGPQTFQGADFTGLVPIAAVADSSKFLQGDGTWATPSGSGNVSASGTPVNNQVAIWTNASTIEGDGKLTFDGVNSLIVDDTLYADSSDGNAHLYLRAFGVTNPSVIFQDTSGNLILRPDNTDITKDLIYIAANSSWTFDSNVQIDTDGVGPFLVLGDGTGNTGDEYLRFNGDRAWGFFQRNDDATTDLELRSATTGKALVITDGGNSNLVQFEFRVSTSGSSAKWYDSAGGDVSTIEQDGTRFKFASANFITLEPGAGSTVNVYRSGQSTELRVYDSDASDYTAIYHDGSAGRIAISNTGILRMDHKMRILQSTGGTGIELMSGTSWTSGTLYMPRIDWIEADGTFQGFMRCYTSNGVASEFEVNLRDDAAGSETMLLAGYNRGLWVRGGGNLRMYASNNSDYIEMTSASGTGYLTTISNTDLILRHGTETYIHGTSNGGVTLYYDGTIHAGTQSLTGDNTSGMHIEDGFGTSTDVGFNTLLWYNPTGSLGSTNAEWRQFAGQIVHSDTTETWTLPSSTSTQVPGGWTILIVNTSGTLTLNAGTGTTLTWLDGSTSPPTGNRSLAAGAIATISRRTSTQYYIWGNAGIS